MGWTYQSLGRGEAGKFFKKMLNWETENIKGELLRGSFHSFREYYAAVKQTDKKTGEVCVFGLAVLLDWRRHDIYNFGYKDMDETMGPYMYNCPKTILNLLTPTDNEKAKEWRRLCWERINNTPKLKDGDTIKTKNPIAFQNMGEFDTFYVKKEGRRVSYHAYVYNRPYMTNRFLLKKRNLVGAQVIAEKVRA